MKESVVRGYVCVTRGIDVFCSKVMRDRVLAKNTSGTNSAIIMKVTQMGSFENGFGWVLGAVCAIVFVVLTITLISSAPSIAHKTWTGIGYG